jgi:hypothetical protein
MRAVSLLLLLGGFSLTAVAGEYASRELALSSLRKDCTLRTTWVGFVPRMPEGVYLSCGDTSFLIISPSNLFGHVVIRDTESALEFARLFTRPETYRFVELGGMVELLPGAASADTDFNIVDEEKFKRHKLQAPTARDISQRGEALRIFEIRRTVVLNGSVYATVETVTENGLYTLISKHKLLKDASKLGVIHFGDV